MNVLTLPAHNETRARRTDPEASHRAAARSAVKMQPTKLAVLRLVDLHECLTGEEINDFYSLITPSDLWPAAKHDTPRKRAGELFNDGYLEAESDPEVGRVYTLSPAGWNAIMQASA